MTQTKEAWFVVCSRLSGCHGTPVSWGWKMQQHSRSHSTPLASFLCLKCKSEILGKSKARLFPPGFEPGTFRVLGERDNHYTTETTRRHSSNDIPKNFMFDHSGPQKLSKEGDPGSSGYPLDKETGF